jgi:16S rRNA processing protein RimM
VGAVRLGKVARALGLRGLLGVAGSEGALGTLQRVTLRRPGEDGVEKVVVEARPQGRLWALQVAGVTDRSAAEAWVGAEVLAAREDLGEAGEGRFFWVDLEGLPVVTVGGEPIGTVIGLVETGAVDVLVVKGERREVLVPLAPYVKVDLEARRVVVDPPEGLLEG